MRNRIIIFLLLFLFGCGGGGTEYNPPQKPIPNDLGGCMGVNALIPTYGNPAIIVDAADFDGTNDYMSRGADLTGIADGKSGIFSVWYRVDGGDGSYRFLLANFGNKFLIEHSNTNVIKVFGQNAAAATILDIQTTTAYTAAGTWLHILASWDLATGTAHLYINDVNDLTSTTLTNDTIDYSTGSPNWWVGATSGGTLRLNGCVAEFYFAPNQYLDFSITANRRKFISSGGKPVHLGIDGSLPVGTPPAVYQHLDDGEAVANFATNRGAGGNFSITGTLTTATTSPSD